MKTSLQPCGTRAAYMRHIENGEDPDVACRRANTEHQGRYIAESPQARGKHAVRVAARQRALARLSAMHPVQYRALYNEEKGR